MSFGKKFTRLTLVRFIAITPILSLSSSTSSSSSDSTSVLSQNQQRRNKLFPYQPQTDFRILLLGQTAIKYSHSNLNHPPIINLIKFMRSLNASMILTNLETAINGTLAQQSKATCINPVWPHITTPDVLDFLMSNYGINFLTTSNNHFSDIGTIGVLSGIEELKKRSISFCGSGKNDLEAMKPGYFLLKNHNNNNSSSNFTKIIGVHSCVSAPLLSIYGGIATSELPGVNALPCDRDKCDCLESKEGLHQFDSKFLIQNLENIKNTSQKTDLMITYHHNHFVDKNLIYELNNEWIQFARKCIENGSDIYLSHGSPNMRGIEIYQGKPIIYSNGNFFFQGYKSYYPLDVRDGYIVDLCYNEEMKLKGVRIIPITLTLRNEEETSSQGIPSIPDPQHALNILFKLQELCKPLGTTIWIDEEDRIGYLILSESQMLSTFEDV